ncbi:ATP-binding protein [Flavitalea flava]
MKHWEHRALQLLERTLNPIPAEINELDWKTALSQKSERIAQHLSAFSNLPGGGFFVFGIQNNGSIKSIEQQEANDIIQKLGNIARNNLAQPVTVDHIIASYNGHSILVVHFPENPIKPVYLRGGTVYDSYKRSAGQTVKMSSMEVATLIANSNNVSFEELVAASNVNPDQVLSLLDYDAFFRMSSKNLPESKTAILDVLVNEGFIKAHPIGNWDVNNLGAILFAKDIREFKGLKRKSVRVIVYEKTNNINALKEREEGRGYAAGFEELIRYIMDQLPTNEIIEHALREKTKMYPEKAIREFVANALIHQDLSISGIGIMIEIYKDRIEITNPGIPLVDTNRFIDTAPKSRNEDMASILRRLNICEERGSGIDRAIAAIEAYQLPAPKFIREENYTKVILYSYRQLTRMDNEDRIRACYQHCCLQYVSSQNTTNQSVRNRFNISETNYPMASRIIVETINAGLIKYSDLRNKSKKNMTYVPYWA